MSSVGVISRRNSASSFAGSGAQYSRRNSASSFAGSGAQYSRPGSAASFYFSKDDEFGHCVESLARYVQLRKDLAHTTHGANAPALIDTIGLKIACLDHYAKARGPARVQTEELEQLIELSSSLAAGHDSMGGVPYKDIKGLDQFLADQIRARCLIYDEEEGDPEWKLRVFEPVEGYNGELVPVGG
ncbi:hypothetical protein G7Y79_00009g025790 [Physcia stellaris]|nr:hypothetical protein G7Y79_00009g025790 [Physcia stellaris]